MVEEKKGGGGKPESYDPATGRYVKENGEYKNFDNFIEKRITTPYFNEHIKDKILKDKRYSLFVNKIDTNVSEEEDKAGIDAKMFFKFNNNVATIDLKVMTSKLGLGEDIPEGYDFILRKQDDYSNGKIVNATILKENLTDSYLISYYKSHREKKEFDNESRKDDILGSYSVLIQKNDIYDIVAKKYNCDQEQAKENLQNEANNLIYFEKKLNSIEEKPRFLRRKDGIYKIRYDKETNKVSKIEKQGNTFNFTLSYNDRNQVNVKVNIKFADMLQYKDSLEIDENDNKELYKSMGLNDKDIKHKTIEELVKKELGLNEDQN